MESLRRHLCRDLLKVILPFVYDDVYAAYYANDSYAVELIWDNMNQSSKGCCNYSDEYDWIVYFAIENGLLDWLSKLKCFIRWRFDQLKERDSVGQSAHEQTYNQYFNNYTLTHDNPQILRWFHEHFGATYNVCDLDTAIGSGCLLNAVYLEEAHKLECTPSALIIALEDGHLESLTWLMDHKARLFERFESKIPKKYYKHLDNVFGWLFLCTKEEVQIQLDKETRTIEWVINNVYPMFACDLSKMAAKNSRTRLYIFLSRLIRRLSTDGSSKGAPMQGPN